MNNQWKNDHGKMGRVGINIKRQLIIKSIRKHPKTKKLRIKHKRSNRCGHTGMDYKQQ